MALCFNVFNERRRSKREICSILIKITQNHYLDTIFLDNCTTDFDETLHVARVCPGEGFGTTGTSGYSPVQKIGGRRPPLNASLDN